VIDWGIVARAIHILAVVAWIGGVWMVTTVLLPGLRGRPAGEWLREFEAIERRFAPQVRIAVLLVLLSGLYMLYAYDLWDRFADARFWWMDLMVGLWALFALMLFVIEPFLAHRLRERRGGVTLPQMLWLHRLLLLLSLATIFAAVGGAHGLF
jgi:uncharacterized membrane protein